jgi:hypothetical protein
MEDRSNRRPVTPTATGRYPLDQTPPERWHNGRWISFGWLLKARS